MTYSLILSRAYNFDQVKMNKLFKHGKRLFCNNKVFDPSPLSSNTNSSGLSNRDPILHVVADTLPQLFEYNSNINILEIGSGKGMHINYFADHFKKDYTNNIIWQPTDRNSDAFHLIEESVTDYNTKDIVNTPLILDLNEMQHQINIGNNNIKYDMIVAINVFHVASLQCWYNLIQHSFYHLFNFDNPNRCLLIYGPFNLNGEYTSESNLKFDKFMKETGNNHDYYLKDINELNDYANQYSLELSQTIEMPNNNFCFIFRTMDKDYNIDFNAS